MMMVLFSGFIQPKGQIPAGWRWAYWLNPMSWTLNALSINEFSSSDYDFLVCVNPPTCTSRMRFGDLSLNSRSIPTDTAWLWYAVPVLLAEYGFFVVLTTLSLKYRRLDDHPAPIVNHQSESDTEQRKEAAITGADLHRGEIPFEPVALAFRGIWYTITLSNGDEHDLLKEIDGYAEPGTMTALMGSSGAGQWI